MGLGHTVNFGRTWLDRSACEFGLISLPYLDGTELEEFRPSQSSQFVKCLWLVPITQSERDYKKSHGAEALESIFEKSQFDYLDPLRQSVV